jgi:hypothetical protein
MGNYEEINRKVIKLVINVILLRNMLERYQLLFNILFETCMDDVEGYIKRIKDEESLRRLRVDLVSNNRRAIKILRSNEIHFNVMDRTEKNISGYTDIFNFREIEITEADLNEVQLKAEKSIKIGWPKRKPKSDIILQKMQRGSGIELSNQQANQRKLRLIFLQITMLKTGRFSQSK